MNFHANIVACLLLASLSGCQTESVVTSDGRPMPTAPSAAPVTPTGAVPNRMAFAVASKPTDSNGNGYPDTIPVTVSLFSVPHPTSLRYDGAMEFNLYSMGQAGADNAEPLSTWRLEGDALTQAHARALYGPYYQFQLNMTKAGGDVYPLMRADLHCRFIPTDGSPPVDSTGVRTIQIGSRRTP